MRNLFKLGEHICAMYDTEEEQLRVAAEYLGDGLRSGQRGLYVADSRPALKRFHVALGEVGINVSSMIKRGALIEATHAEAHLENGHFDSERMLRLLNQAVETALNDGFSGLRTCGDMSWLLHRPAGADQVVEYEALLNQLFHGVLAAGMCQYDRRRLSPELLDHALATHSSAVVDGHHKTNPFYLPAAVAIKRSATPADLDSKLGALRQR